MNLREQLLKEHSKQNATYIANYVDNDPRKFAKLIELFLCDEYRVAQRAAYSLGISTDNYPELIIPYIGPLVDNLENTVTDAVKRNTVRTLQHLEVPEEYEGKLTQKCFDYLTSGKEPVAIKVFSMTILCNMAIKYPDLTNELKIVVEELMENGSPGIISRGKRILKRLNSIK